MSYVDFVNVLAVVFGVGSVLIIWGLILTVFSRWDFAFEVVAKAGICWLAFVGGTLFILMCPLFYH